MSELVELKLGNNRVLTAYSVINTFTKNNFHIRYCIVNNNQYFWSIDDISKITKQSVRSLLGFSMYLADDYNYKILGAFLESHSLSFIQTEMLLIALLLTPELKKLRNQLTKYSIKYVQPSIQYNAAIYFLVSILNDKCNNFIKNGTQIPDEIKTDAQIKKINLAKEFGIPLSKIDADIQFLLAKYWIHSSQSKSYLESQLEITEQRYHQIILWDLFMFFQQTNQSQIGYLIKDFCCIDYISEGESYIEISFLVYFMNQDEVEEYADSIKKALKICLLCHQKQIRFFTRDSQPYEVEKIEASKKLLDQQIRSRLTLNIAAR